MHADMYDIFEIWQCAFCKSRNMCHAVTRNATVCVIDVCVVFVCSIQPMFIVILSALPDVCKHGGYGANRALCTHTKPYYRPILSCRREDTNRQIER